MQVESEPLFLLAIAEKWRLDKGALGAVAMVFIAQRLGL